VQAAVQHTPSAQAPLVHASFVVQGAPFLPFARHVPWSHHPLASQSSLAAQPALQAPAAQGYGLQSAKAVAMHVPDPLHAWPVGALPWQSAGAHGVDAAKDAQAPLPSHVPSRPQVLASCAGQEECTTPAAASEQAPSTGAPPSLPADWFFARQLWQTPSHRESQHTRSTQKPDAHAVSRSHEAPPARSIRHSCTVVSQWPVAAQSPSAEHVDEHPPALQRPGEQSTGAALDAHEPGWPRPSHSFPPTTCVPSALHAPGAPHEVPLA
jgi:hypothetical protein